MSPQLRVNRLWAFTTVTKKFIIVAINYEAILLIGNQTVFTLGDKTLTYSFYIVRIKIAIRCVAVMQLRMGCRLLWLFDRHFSTLVIAH